MESLRVGIFLFNEVEVLDFAGPFEVFSLAQQAQQAIFEVVTISENGQMIEAINGLKVTPDYSFENCPKLDVLIIPGGAGAREKERYHQPTLDWIRLKDLETRHTLSICTGAFILAELGLLNGRKATTHWASVSRLQREFPQITVLKEVKYVDQGEILTAAGISAGIDLSFYYIEKNFGKEIAEATAKQMEYEWSK